MSDSFYERSREGSPLGIRILYQTIPGGHHPLHWHEELEILYPLNGDSDLLIDGQRYRLPKKHLTVIEARRVHSTQIRGDTAMNICIHVTKNRLRDYLPEIGRYEIRCMPEEIPDERFPAYLDLCELLAELTRLYIRDTPVLSMEAEGIVLQVMARLLREFSVKRGESGQETDPVQTGRIHQVLDWTERHFREPVSLAEIADETGVSREYFCRLFRRSMGIPYQQYLAEVRLNHIYRELQNTDAPVAEIMEENGFTNQKRFNASFKALYGRTPSQVRQEGRSSGGNSFPAGV